jgi:hypothetical protein
VIRVLAATTALAAALLVGAVPGQAAGECKGLQVCIPVKGPWVAVPPPGGLATATSWKLSCPQGVVGGVDARVSEKEVAIEFPGRVGSPVNPGITTSSSLVFRGTYAGAVPRATTYQPYIGCIPTAGGGPRTRTAFQKVAPVKPGYPITVRARTIDLEAGTLSRTSLGCKPKERLLASSSSVGLYTTGMPTKAQLAAVHVIRVQRGTRVLVSATRGALADGVRAQLQVQAVCAA